MTGAAFIFVAIYTLSKKPKIQLMKSFAILPDQQLIHLYMEGNADALSTLVYRYKDKLYSSIYFLVKDKYLAEDFFQDTSFKIIDLLSAGKYKEEGKFLPWAMRIAHNLCVNQNPG